MLIIHSWVSSVLNQCGYSLSRVCICMYVCMNTYFFKRDIFFIFFIFLRFLQSMLEYNNVNNRRITEC